MTDMTKKLALLCTVSVLTLGLAACNSTGTKTPVKPAGQGDTSELGTARTAAKTAMDAAKAAWDAAEAEARKAETAVMGLAGVQTGAMAKKKAMEARTAANAAKAAYDKAKAAHDKAAAATTVTAAAEARLDAEAEQKKAEAEQKTAVAAAKMAMDAAGVEVKVAYDEDGKATYSVGDKSIMADAPKTVRGEGDTAVTTGKVGDITFMSDAGKSSAYVAATKKLSQPTIAARTMKLGREVDSDDDSARLKIIDKYIGEKTVYMYIAAPTGGAGVTNSDAPAAGRPYGRVTITDSSSRSHLATVMRATGEFYRVADTGGHFTRDDSSGPAGNAQTVPADATDDNAKELTGIYYFLAPFTGTIGGGTFEKGDRVWLQRVSNTAFSFQVISVREGVKFPKEMPYEHMNYGMWAALKDNKDGDNDDDTSGLGTAFVNALSGKAMTPAADMPTSGSATYKGNWLAHVRERSEDGEGIISEYKGGSETTANFAKDTVKVELSTAAVAGGQGDGGNEGSPAATFATMEGTMSGNGFEGTKVTVDSETTVNVDTSGTFTGTMSGNFFGPRAEEVGGVFDYTSTDKKAGEFRGAFGGRRGE